MSQSQAANKAWGGVFEEAADPRMEKFTESISFDRRLYRQDIRGSQAHAAMLAKVGVLTDAEAAAIRDGLEGILRDIEAGKFEYSLKLEDIHMHVEKELINRWTVCSRTSRNRSSTAATRISTAFCRATRTRSAPSRCSRRTTGSATWRSSRGTVSVWPTAGSG